MTNLGPNPFGRPVLDACLLAGGEVADLSTTITVGVAGADAGYQNGFPGFGSMSSTAFGGETIQELSARSTENTFTVRFNGGAQPAGVDAVQVAFASGGPTIVAKWDGSDRFKATGNKSLAVHTHLNTTIGNGNSVGVTVSNYPVDTGTYNYLLTLGSITGQTVGNNYAGFSGTSPFGDITPDTFGGELITRLYARQSQRVRLSFDLNAQPNSATTITCNIEGAPDNPYSLVWDGFASYEEEDNTIALDLYNYLIGLGDDTVLGVSLVQTAP